jgi:hypothetical protein
MSEFRESVLIDSDDPDDLPLAAWNEIRDSVRFLSLSEVFKENGKIIRRGWSSLPAVPFDTTLDSGATPEEALAILKRDLKKPDTRTVEVINKDGRVVIRRWTNSHFVLSEHHEV